MRCCTRNMRRIKKNCAGYIAKNARGSHFDERAARRVARRRRRLGDASKFARCYISSTFVPTLIIRDSTGPSVTRGLTNDLSDAIDRVIESFSVFLCARHFSHAIKLPGQLENRRSTLPKLSRSLNLYQFDCKTIFLFMQKTNIECCLSYRSQIEFAMSYFTVRYIYMYNSIF